MPDPRVLDQLCIDTIRTLSMDAVQEANSGHPGTPMGLAPVAYCLWQRFLRYDPADPLWPGRDRFVLSAGHASMLLYSLLHLAGVREVGPNGAPTGRPAVSLDDIRRFRQLGSRCPGHPEYRQTTGVETTTGPLGQGAATSVGMALAARWRSARFASVGFGIFGFDVYTLVSDGDLMEGVASEAASLAGHLALGNLCWVYDNNHVSIEGPTGLAFTENVGERFEAYGWSVDRVADANDLDALTGAFRAFGDSDDRPTLIIVDSHIAYGAPNKQDSHTAHGAPLGEDEVRLAKRAYGWPEDERFLVPSCVPAHFAAGIGARGAEASRSWRDAFGRYRAAEPERSVAFERMMRGELPEGWDASLPEFPSGGKAVSTRAASGRVLNRIAEQIPWLLGGSADLGSSNNTVLTFEGAGEQDARTPGGRNVHFGVREHAMCAAVNGLTLSGIRAYGGTFLIFSDYARPAIRVAALMGIPSVYVFTHDSIALGEDGPTHQPVEQLASLRAMPGIVIIRPADANETADAWRVVMSLREEPAALVLSRQGLPVLDRELCAPSQVARGAYVLIEPEGGPDVVLIGTGSEVHLCVEAHARLSARGIDARVVSMPSWELFERQDASYKGDVLPSSVTARVVVEAASPMGWERYAGPRGAVIAMRRFGASAPMRDLEDAFGFTADAVASAAEEQVRLHLGR